MRTLHENVNNALIQKVKQNLSTIISYSITKNFFQLFCDIIYQLKKGAGLIIKFTLKWSSTNLFFQ